MWQDTSTKKTNRVWDVPTNILCHRQLVISLPTKLMPLHPFLRTSANKIIYEKEITIMGYIKPIPVDKEKDQQKRRNRNGSNVFSLCGLYHSSINVKDRAGINL